MKDLSPHTQSFEREDARPNWASIGLFIATVIALVMAVLLWNGVFSEAWQHYATAADPVPKTEALRNLTWSMGTIGAVIGGFIGLVMAGFRTAALHRQAKTGERDSKFSEKKHESEAFAVAIGQLGEGNFATRLGAVYALEALAKSSKNLHGPIFETLCAYVRQEAPAPKGDDLSIKITACGETAICDIIHEHLQTVPPPHVVVQAILTVIGRRETKHDPNKFRLDLQNTDLRKADLRRGDFSHAILTNSHLSNALLVHTNLKGALLNATHFEGAKLSRANLDKANLHKAHFEGANLNESSLKGTTLRRANFISVSLSRSNLEEAELSNANLKGATLFNTNLKGASLDGANLEGAYLSGAGLQEVEFNGGIFSLDVSFDDRTVVDGANLSTAKGIPAIPGYSFRTTVHSSDDTIWPADEDPEAWDRGDEST